MVEPFTALWVRELGPLSWFDDPDSAVDRTTALAFTILAVGQIVATPLWGRCSDRSGPVRLLAFVALALAAVAFATGWVERIEAYLGLRCVAAVFMAGMTTLAYAGVTRRIEAGRRSLAFSLVQSATQLGLSIGPLCGSAVSAVTGLRYLWWVAGGVLALAAVGLRILRRLERA